MSPDQRTELDVARLMAELRAESPGAESFSVIPRGVPRPVTPQERNSSVIEPSIVGTNRSSASLDELLALEGEEFVNRAYLEMLGRRPDLEGSKFYSGQLATGRLTKIEILDALRRSPEGRKRGASVAGLAGRARWHRVFRLPIVGYVFRAGWLIVSLPRVTANLRAFETHVRVQLANQAAQIQSAERSKTDEVRALKNRLGATERAQREFEDRLNGKIVELMDSFREEALPMLVRGEERVASLVQTLGEFRAALEEELGALRRQAGDVQQELGALRGQVSRQAAGLLDQERRLTIFLEEARRRLPQPFDSGQLANLTAHSDHMLDRLYLLIEDRFRGTRADIKSRQRIYVADARAALGDSPDRPIVDLGCGRGEWLELMRDEGLAAFGVDLNETMIGACRTLGLEVVASDALEFLRQRPEGSLSAITGFHIIEHMTVVRLIALIDEALRALKPGGLLLFETPNPENVLVSTHNFYTDPTHLRPLPSILMAALLEARGFLRVEVRNLHPHPNIANRYEIEALNDFTRHFYGPQDYGVLAWKPRE